MLGSRGEVFVLIVEDEPLVREIAVDEFREAGYRVLTAVDEMTAMKILESDQDLDLLFTDIRFPGTRDGWGVARAARQLHPDLPVIYATGFSPEQADMVDGARFFKKPYRFAAVLSAAEELLSAKK